jgi:aminoglycoside 3-N-acetyltransferase
MDQRECSREIAADLGALGVRPGDTVLMHASFKSLGPVPGGIETVILGFLHAIGTEGTLLLPALSWALRPPVVFDVKATPANVGAIPEYFRTRPGTCRSVHPTHSVCAFGRRTHELLDDHTLDCTPCGPYSPFRKLTETGGKIVMLGCGLGPNTTMHALEEVAGVPYVLGPALVFTITDPQGNTYQKAYRTHGFSARGYAQRYDKIAQLDTAGFMTMGQVLKAPTFVLDSPGLKEAVLRKMKEDPLFFVDAKPVKEEKR